MAAVWALSLCRAVLPLQKGLRCKWLKSIKRSQTNNLFSNPNCKFSHKKFKWNHSNTKDKTTIYKIYCWIQKSPFLKQALVTASNNASVESIHLSQRFMESETWMFLLSISWTILKVHVDLPGADLGLFRYEKLSSRWNSWIGVHKSGGNSGPPELCNVRLKSCKKAWLRKGHLLARI